MMKLVVALVALASCVSTTKNPAACQDNVCIDPERPYCDSDGSVAGTPDACIALSCEPGELVACNDAGAALTCTSTGDDTSATACAVGCDTAQGGCIAQGCVGDKLITQLPDATTTMETCAAGCAVSPSPHCVHIVPRYLPDVCDRPATTSDLVISSSGMFDTMLDSNCNGGILVQEGGPEICVVHHPTITITNGAELRIVGFTNDGVSAGRAVALVADRNIDVVGVIDVSAGVTATLDPPPVSGPGGGLTSSGGSIVTGNGGGGAGFKTLGGHGATQTADGAANNGGAASLDPITSAILVGGAHSSGGGGGAMTLVACSGAVNVAGTIAANGGGGVGGFPSPLSGNPLPGGGGGAGGYVVFQGLSVAVTGEVFANGGGGGGGRIPGMVFGAPGENGLRSESCAPGGNRNMGEGAGGTGGCLGTPGGGKHPTAAGTTPGGGGGSVGFFQSYTATLEAAVLTPALSSPRFQPPALVPTR